MSVQKQHLWEEARRGSQDAAMQILTDCIRHQDWKGIAEIGKLMDKKKDYSFLTDKNKERLNLS